MFMTYTTPIILGFSLVFRLDMLKKPFNIKATDWAECECVIDWDKCSEYSVAKIFVFY